MIVPQGRHELEHYLEVMLDEEHVPLSLRTRLLGDDGRNEWRELDRHIPASTRNSRRRPGRILPHVF